VAPPHDTDPASASFKAAPYEYWGRLRKWAPMERVKLGNGASAWLRTAPHYKSESAFGTRPSFRSR
jgi:hypothetical protein